MYCPLCAEPIEAGQARCPSCGAPVQVDPPHSPEPPEPPEPVEWTPPPTMTGYTAPNPPLAPAPATTETPPPDRLRAGPGYPAGPGDESTSGATHTGYTGYTEHSRYPGAPESPGVPGHAQSRGGPPVPVPGDWRGAIAAMVSSVGGIYAIGVVVALFYAAVNGELSTRALFAAPATAVATAFGATWKLTVGTSNPDEFGSGGDASYTIRAYPLLFTVLGIWLIARAARRRFAAGHSSTTLLARVTQAARVGLLIGVTCLLLALVSRQPVGISGHLNAEYPLALIGGLVISALTVTVVALQHDLRQAPPAWQRFSAAVAEPLVALRIVVPVIMVAGVLALLATLVFGGVNEDLSLLGLDTTTTRSAGSGLLVPYGPNASWMLFAVVVGAPLQVNTGIGFGLDETGSLLDLADGAPWWWAAPLLALVVLFGAGVLLALRSPTAVLARRRVAVWSLTFAAASLTLTYAGRITLGVRSSFGELAASVGNELILTAILSWAWALLCGLGGVALVQHLAPGTRTRWTARVTPTPPPPTTPPWSLPT